MSSQELIVTVRVNKDLVIVDHLLPDGEQVDVFPAGFTGSRECYFTLSGENIVTVATYEAEKFRPSSFLGIPGETEVRETGCPRFFAKCGACTGKGNTDPGSVSGASLVAAVQLDDAIANALL